jgi:hypothetical protein
MTNPTKKVLGVGLIIASAAFLFPPLFVVVVPILAHYYPIGITVEKGSALFRVAASTTGAAALVGGLWLLSQSKRSPP